MGIDFGEKRIGLAIAEGDLAVPLETLERASDRVAIATISALAIERHITELIVGEPLASDGTRSEAAERVRRFGEKLERRSRLVVTYVDENLTSHEEEARLAQAGVDIERRPEAIDAMAAAILLQQEIDRRSSERKRCGGAGG